MPYNRKAFGLVISRLRTQKGLTQERMSGLAGIARSHLVALENGEKTVLACAERFGVSRVFTTGKKEILECCRLQTPVMEIERYMVPEWMVEQG